MTDTRPQLQPGTPLLFRGPPATFQREIPQQERDSIPGIQGELEIEQRGRQLRCFWDQVRVIEPEGEPCLHLSVTPTCTEDDLRGLSATEVRKRFPRFQGACPNCGKNVIAYASMYHYMAGDW